MRTLVVASSAKTAGFGVPSSLPKWRTRHRFELVASIRSEVFQRIIDAATAKPPMFGVILVHSFSRLCLRVVKRGGAAVSISGPPDPAFARERGLNLVLKLVMRLVSAKIRKQAKRHGIRYSFLSWSAAARS
jgi:hypothetical protein